METTMISISQAIKEYLESVKLARSQNTARSYRIAMNAFSTVLAENGYPLETDAIHDLTEDAVTWFANFLKNYSPATEQLYLTAVSGFYEYLAAEKLADPNLPRVRLLLRKRARKPGQRLPQFPREKIEEVIEYAIKLDTFTCEDQNEHLRFLRDKAFILTLADTGLRVHEAVELRRGDIDWNEGRAIVIGKGNRQAIVRFSNRSLKALRSYLNTRKELDGKTGKPLASLPVFARHDRGAGKKIKNITTTTGRNIISQRVKEGIGSQVAEEITPHSFRHYFVTTILHATQGNIKLAQELARHKNIAITQRYAHLSDDELDRGYWEIFDQN
jgi:integrase/recombinase XerC